jgi:hypothetical protein
MAHICGRTMNNSTLRLFGGHCLLGNYEIRPPPKNRRILADRGALSRGIIQFRTRAWKRKSAILPMGCSNSELGAGRSMCRESARPPIPGRRYPISENSPMTSDDGDVTSSRDRDVTLSRDGDLTLSHKRGPWRAHGGLPALSRTADR